MPTYLFGYFLLNLRVCVAVNANFFQLQSASCLPGVHGLKNTTQKTLEGGGKGIIKGILSHKIRMFSINKVPSVCLVTMDSKLVGYRRERL